MRDAGRICSRVELEVREAWKVAAASGRFTITLGGGTLGDRRVVVPGQADYTPGEEVVVAEPTFLIYALQAKASGARVRAVPLRGLRYDLVGMRRAVTSRTKLSARTSKLPVARA